MKLMDVGELQAIAAAEREQRISAAAASRQREIVELGLVRRVSDTRWDCMICGAVGSQPAHSLSCPLYRRLPW